MLHARRKRFRIGLKTMRACHRTPLEEMGAAETLSRTQYTRCCTISSALLTFIIAVPARNTEASQLCLCTQKTVDIAPLIQQERHLTHSSARC